MWVWVVLGVLLLVMVGLFFLPLQLYLNTIKNEYVVRLGHIAKAYLESDKKEIIRFRIRVLGYQFFLYPLKTKGSRKAIETPKKKVRKKNFKGKRIFQLARAFKIHAFELNVDTGNYVTNAQLYPLLGFLNHHLARCRINYEGNNSLVMDIRSRPVTILKSIINY